MRKSQEQSVGQSENPLSFGGVLKHGFTVTAWKWLSGCFLVSGFSASLIHWGIGVVAFCALIFYFTRTYGSRIVAMSLNKSVFHMGSSFNVGDVDIAKMPCDIELDAVSAEAMLKERMF